MTACGLGRLGVCLSFAAATLIALAAPSTAAGQGCPSADPSLHRQLRSQTFTVPSWGDAGGWTDPSKYSTIQLGRRQRRRPRRADRPQRRRPRDLPVRHDARPVAPAGRRQRSAAGAGAISPRHRRRRRATPCSWHDPSYYMTIQAGDVDRPAGRGDRGPFLRRDPHLSGTPRPTGGQNIDGGTWRRISTAGPYSDANGYDDPSLYPTIHLAQLRSGDPAIARSRASTASAGVRRWRSTPSTRRAWRAPSCWDERDRRDLTASPTRSAASRRVISTCETADVYAARPEDRRHLTSIGRNKLGLSAFSGDPFVGWTMVGGGAGVAGSFADVASSDCPFSAGASPGPGAATVSAAVRPTTRRCRPPTSTA